MRIPILATLLLFSAVAFANPFAGKEPKFPMTRGWLGSDLAYSVKLTEDKYLWLFGDTFVLAPQGKKYWVSMIPSTVGISQIREEGEYHIDYYWRGQGTKEPRAIFPHDRKDEGYLYWPKDAILIDDVLYVALVEIVAVEANALGFRETKTYLAKVNNPHDIPSEWNYENVEFSPDPEVYAGTRFIHNNGYVYWYSTVKRAAEHSKQLPLGEYHKFPMVLQRVKASKMERFEEAQEYLDINGKWQKGFDLTRAKPVMDHGATEMTVHWSEHYQKWIAVYGEGALSSDKVVMRIADSLEGPWSEQKEIFQFPEMQRGTEKYVEHGMGYAAKIHPQFLDPKKPNVLTMTYVINTLGVEHLFNRPENTTAYVPKVVSIDMDNIIAKLDPSAKPKGALSRFGSKVLSCLKALK